jgi:hypothetical protein
LALARHPAHGRGSPLAAAGVYSVLGRREIALFFALLLTDGSLLLLGQFESGPVAIAFLLRLATIDLCPRSMSLNRCDIVNP